MRTIRTFITYIAALLSAATAVLSCSVGTYDMEPGSDRNSYRTIRISGVVSDESGNTLEDISITFQAYPDDDPGAAAITTETVYTNSKGIYSINCDGPDERVRCIIAAADPQGTYQSQMNEIIVSWQGTAFDEQTNTFVVNDCNFKLAMK